MMSAATLLKPPACVRGMKILDKAAFARKVTVPCLTIATNKLDKARIAFKPYLLKAEKFQPIVKASDGVAKTVLLSPDLVKSMGDLQEPHQKVLKELGHAELESTEIELNYDNWSSEQILRAVLPVDEEGSKAYSSIGHILHVNLHEHLLPYKSVIGQVLLDKVSTARTVVNKSDPIDNTYRNFSMEVLAGDAGLVTSVRENNCTFHLDFGKVYWNSRLGTEHSRIVSMISSHDVVYDVFAGVGPFAVPAARKGARVLANDLNPDSFEWLQKNVEANKAGKKGGSVKCYNMDGREFIQTVVKKDLDQLFTADDDPNAKVHVIMNLPAMATTFLDAFKGLLNPSCRSAKNVVPVIFHVYCFAKDFSPEKLALELVEKDVGFQLGQNLKELLLVRKVAPSKHMARLTFNYPLDILCANPDEPVAKKPCLEVSEQSQVSSA